MNKNFVKKSIEFISAVLILITSCKIMPDSSKQKNRDVPYKTKPKTVQNLNAPKIVTTSDNEITLKWGYVDDADGYYVYYQKANDYVKGESPKLKVVDSADTTSVTFTDLESAERYVFKVRSYRVIDGTIIFGDESTPFESATRPTLELQTSVQNKKATLYFATSERSSVLTPGEYIYAPEFDIYSSDPTLFNETNSNPVATFDINNTPQYVKTTPEIEVTTDNELRSNSVVKFQVYMNINEVLQSTKNEVEINNPPEYYPSGIFISNVSKGEKDKIELSFTASPINEGLEDNPDITEIKQYFDVVRTNTTTNVKENITLHKTFDDDVKSGKINKISDFDFEIMDKNVITNTDYIYSITPWYMIKKGEFVTWYEGTDVHKTDTAYSRSTPTNVKASLILPDDNDSRPKTTKNKFLDSQNNATYKINLTWALPHDDEETTFNLHRLEYAPGASTPTDVLIKENLKSNENSFEDDKTLSMVDDRQKWEFRYYIIPKEDDTTSETNKSIVYAENTIESTPSIEQIDFITSFTATNEDENATKIILSWDAITEENLKRYDANMSVNNIVFNIKRTKSTMDGYTSIKENLPYGTTTYSDENLEDGVAYFYTLEAVYKDESSTYNNQSTILRLDNAKTLSAVKSLSASASTSIEYIKIEFEKIDNATDYILEYTDDKSNDSSWKNASEFLNSESSFENGLLFFTKDAGTENAGKNYYFRIKSIDKNGVKVGTWCTTDSDGNEAVGSIFGPHGFTISSSTDMGQVRANSILLNWNVLKGATRYEVKVYSDSTLKTTIYTKFVNTNSFVFDTSLVNDSLFTDGYALSRDYYFKVIPLMGSDKISEDYLKSTSGHWLFPPKNIKATKAESRDMVKLSWDAVDGVDGYNIYRKNIDSTNWTYLSYVPSTNNRIYRDISASLSTEYEYTIESKKGNVVSEKQTYFVNENNRGYRLSPPTDLSTAEIGTSLYAVSFTPSIGVSGYNLKTQTDSLSLTTEQLLNGGIASEGNRGYVALEKDEDGNVNRATVYLNRPVVVTTPVIRVEIYTSNANGAISQTTSHQELVSSLTSAEIVNLVNYSISSVLMAANDQFKGDWWGFNSNKYSDTGVYIQGESGTTGNDDAYLRFSNYYEPASGCYLNTTEDIKLHAKNGGGAGYLGTDPLKFIGRSNIGKIQVSLPYDYGTATIGYNYLAVDGTSGSYTVSYNGKTETVQYYQVADAVRKFLI